MAKRKYFGASIVELEALFAENKAELAILKDIKEELLHRKRKRAIQLLVQVKQALRYFNDAPMEAPEPARPSQQIYTTAPETKQSAPQEATQATETPVEEEYEEPELPNINWDEELEYVEQNAAKLESEARPVKPIENKPSDLLDAWTAIEALSPLTYLKPSDLKIGYGDVAAISANGLPWPWSKSRAGCRLFYSVYLGSLDLEACTKDLLEVYQDQREEKPNLRGKAALAAVVVDKNGVPTDIEGMAISSFGWSYSRALSGSLDDLKHWNFVEQKLCEGLEKILLRRDDESDEVLPLDWEAIMQAHRWLMKNCAIPERVSTGPEFAIKRFAPFSIGVPEAPLLNSFFLADLQKAKAQVERNQAGCALRQYLGIDKSDEQVDLFEDNEELKDILQPNNFSLGRWPVQGRFPLVLMQQVAVNFAKRELNEEGLFSVNGPPGTGKTTLLRDIVADVVVERAIAMSEFNKPVDAFRKTTESFTSQGVKCFVHDVDETLKGHEILVASSNNKAVENISKELPLMGAIDDSIDLNYFKPLGDSLLEEGEESWGVIATVLGNSANKTKFARKVWWEKDTSLQSYFQYIAGSLDCDEDEDGNEIIPSIVDHGEPPENIHEALDNWQNAKKEFSAGLKQAMAVREAAQQAFEGEQFLAEYKEKRNKLESDSVLLTDQLADKERDFSATQKDLLEKQGKLALCQDSVRRHAQTKSGFWERLIFRAKHREWKLKASDLNLRAKAQKKAVLDAEQLAKDESTALEECKRARILVSNKIHELDALNDEYKAKISDAFEICGEKLVNDEVLSLSHTDKQLFSPVYTAIAHTYRDELFVLAIKLHKAFIDAAYRPISQNLLAFVRVLANKKLACSALLSDVWATGFMICPVFSTAFASIDRMLNRMPSESIGWLLIDEAGQASPQHAIGAIMRSKRVMAVGDPLQIEPVVSTPMPLLEGIASYMGVSCTDWIAPDASVQAVADRANKYGATIDKGFSTLWIGSPLLVHRRCDDPMFTISNKLAYNGKMVKATVTKPSNIAQVFGGNAKWFDVNGHGNDKWCAASGNFVAEKILEAARLEGDQLELFVISPFRLVAQSMQERMRKEISALSEYGLKNPASWINNSIGTVHTFQGKEAETVILLLGAPNPNQAGARSWAASSVNLMNVAVSRAQRNFYVVGNQELWSEAGKMSLIMKEIRKASRNDI